MAMGRQLEIAELYLLDLALITKLSDQYVLKFDLSVHELLLIVQEEDALQHLIENCSDNLLFKLGALTLEHAFLPIVEERSVLGVLKHLIEVTLVL